jgi:transcriptional regulator with XRE-family HTH domain
MTMKMSENVSKLVRRLRREAGLTQSELAERIDTTQSVISRLEDDDYEGHSLSMLYRIGAALNRRIIVTATGGERPRMTVREEAPGYDPTTEAPAGGDESLATVDSDRFATRIARRFADQGVTESDVLEAVRWARGGNALPSLEELRGAIKVGAGNVQNDLRRARARRGRESGARQ